MTNADNLRAKLTAVADAVRAKTGSTETMTLDEMAQAIAGIRSGNDDAGGDAEPGEEGE